MATYRQDSGKKVTIRLTSKGHTFILNYDKQDEEVAMYTLVRWAVQNYCGVFMIIDACAMASQMGSIQMAVICNLYDKATKG